MDSQQTNKVIGQFTIINQIGRSQHGVSFLAQPDGVSRLIALRLYPSQFLTHTDFMEHFLIEAEAVKMLSHPHIPRMYTYGQVEKFPFIARRYIEGENLLSRLEKGNMPLFKIERYLHNLCLALEYAHEQDVVHGNIHPNNILFDKEDKVYLTDFGVNAIKHNPFVKSPYHAPELAQSRTADVKSDIYSLGIILFEWITGKPPIWSDSVSSTRQKALPSVRIYHPTASPLLDDVIACATSPNPDLRYNSVKEFFRAYIKAVDESQTQTYNRPHPLNIADFSHDKKIDYAHLNEPHKKETYLPTWLNAIFMVIVGVFVFLLLTRAFANSSSDANPKNNYVYQPAAIPDGYVLYATDKIEMAVPSWWEDVNTPEHSQYLSESIEQLDGQVSSEFYDLLQQVRPELATLVKEIDAIDRSSGTNVNVQVFPYRYTESSDLITQFEAEMEQYGINVLDSGTTQIPVGEAIYFHAVLPMLDISPIVDIVVIQMNNNIYQISFTSDSPADTQILEVMVDTFRIKP
ncbi:MAG: serine/threonine protein kinase [Anaerolineae bacterium]|nr:serine/threonine protein kinase [Anaerolineae bacterium]